MATDKVNAPAVVKTEPTWFGWLAFDSDLYCCPECSIIGTGKTEKDALDDLHIKAGAKSCQKLVQQLASWPERLKR